MEESNRVCRRYLQSYGKFSEGRDVRIDVAVTSSSCAIVANIAEGAGRRISKEFPQFLSHSQGSASEVDTELVIAERLHYLTRSAYERLADDLDHIGRMITRLSQTLTTA